MEKIIVSEFVSYGHPDKIADQISDAILDAFLEKDRHVKAGIEVMIKDNVVVLGGEIKSDATINYESVVRDVMSNFHFSDKHGLQPENIKIINLIGKQSPEINKGVEQENGIIGAGDQGFMVGFASNETPSYLPLGVYLSKKIVQHVSDSISSYIGPDAKSQVIVDYSGEEPVVKHILVSVMHQIGLNELVFFIKDSILNNRVGLDEKLFEKYIKNNDKLVIDVNPCGAWEIGGPVSDCGVTGRKIVVDQFGGYCNVGGGAKSGKDGTKCDRSAAYAARYIAKNIVASGLSNTCKVVLSYMIGVPEPSSICIETDTKLDNVKLEKIIRSYFDLTPRGIIERFNLTDPIFYKTARYGHYGNSNYPWEKLDLVNVIKEKY